MNHSNFSLFYKNICSVIEHQPQSYLTVYLPICFIRVIAQLSTASKFIINVTFKNIKYTINPNEECKLCNRNELEDLFRIVVSCPIYIVLRKQFIPNFAGLNENNYCTLLYSLTLQIMKSLYV